MPDSIYSAVVSLRPGILDPALFEADGKKASEAWKRGYDKGTSGSRMPSETSGGSSGGGQSILPGGGAAPTGVFQDSNGTWRNPDGSAAAIDSKGNPISPANVPKEKLPSETKDPLSKSSSKSSNGLNDIMSGAGIGGKAGLAGALGVGAAASR